MDPSKLRKRQIARRLGVSEQILEQYLQLKRAEVLQGKPAGADASALGGDRGVPAVSGYAGTASVRGSGAIHSTPSRGSGRLHPSSGARDRGPRGD